MPGRLLSAPELEITEAEFELGFRRIRPALRHVPGDIESALRSAQGPQAFELYAVHAGAVSLLVGGDGTGA